LQCARSAQGRGAPHQSAARQARDPASASALQSWRRRSRSSASIKSARGARPTRQLIMHWQALHATQRARMTHLQRLLLRLVADRTIPSSSSTRAGFLCTLCCTFEPQLAHSILSRRVGLDACRSLRYQRLTLLWVCPAGSPSRYRPGRCLSRCPASSRSAPRLASL